MGRHDIQHNGIICDSMKDSQHNDISISCHYAECRYAECHYAEGIMLSVVMLSVVAPL